MILGDPSQPEGFRGGVEGCSPGAVQDFLWGRTSESVGSYRAVPLTWGVPQAPKPWERWERTERSGRGFEVWSVVVVTWELLSSVPGGAWLGLPELET